MVSKITILAHKIAIQLHLVAESCTICSYRSRRPVWKLSETPTNMEEGVAYSKGFERLGQFLITRHLAGNGDFSILMVITTVSTSDGTSAQRGTWQGATPRMSSLTRRYASFRHTTFRQTDRHYSCTYRTSLSTRVTGASTWRLLNRR
jgi:hypothetical protein